MHASTREFFTGTSVERRHHANRLIDRAQFVLTVLSGRGDNSKAQRFRKNKNVSWLSLVVRQHAIWRHPADDGEAENRLLGFDCVSSHYRNAGFRRFVGSALQN